MKIIIRNIFPGIINGSLLVFTTVFAELVATAGGIRVDVVKDAVRSGADIIVVGRAITASKDPHTQADLFLEQLNREEIDQYRVMTDF